MFESISILKKRRFIHVQRKNYTHIYTSPIVIIPLILVSISSLLIFSIQKQSVYNDSLNHIVSGFIGYFIAITISYIPIEKFKKFTIPLYFLSLLSLVHLLYWDFKLWCAKMAWYRSFYVSTFRNCKISYGIFLGVSIGKKKNFFF